MINSSNDRLLRVCSTSGTIVITIKGNTDTHTHTNTFSPLPSDSMKDGIRLKGSPSSCVVVKVRAVASQYHTLFVRFVCLYIRRDCAREVEFSRFMVFFFLLP